MLSSSKTIKKFMNSFIIFLIAVVLLHTASASGLSVSYKAINGDVVQGTGSYATFTLTIDNGANAKKTVNIRTLDSLDWNVVVEPSLSNRVDVDANSEGSFLLRVSEVKRNGVYAKNLGTYKLSVIVESGDDKITIPVYVNVISRDSLLTRSYQPDVIVKDELLTTKIDPREKPNLKVSLQNMNLRNITRIDITVTSQKNSIYQTGTTSLGPLESKVVDFSLNFNPDEAPKTDTLMVRVETKGDDGQIYPKAQPEPIPFEIVEYSTVIRDTKVDDYFMKKETTITVYDDGNVNKDAQVKVEAGLFERLFTTTTPKADFVSEDNQHFFVWNLELKARDSSGKLDTRVLVVTNNYRPLFVIFLALIAMVIFYYIFRSPVLVRKDVSKILTKEGGIAGLKIIIHLKNRSNRTVENLKVVDRIPSITEVEKDFEAGTLKPSSITKGRTSISVNWEIASLEPFEERMITYHIRSKLSVLGGFDLKHAVVKYTKKNGQEVVITSNNIDLSQKIFE